MTKIRIANSDDDEKITEVINAAFKIAEEFFVDSNRITLEEVRRHRASGAFLVAESDVAIDGCVYVEPRGERAYLGLLSVNPARQQGGLSISMQLHLFDGRNRRCRTDSRNARIFRQIGDPEYYHGGSGPRGKRCR